MCKQCGVTTSKDTAPLSQGCGGVPEKKIFLWRRISHGGAFPSPPRWGPIQEWSRHKKRVKIRWLCRRDSLDLQITWFDTEGLLLWRSVKDKIYGQHRSLELQELRECALKATAFVLFHLLKRTCHEILARCRRKPRNLWNPYLIFVKKFWNVKLYFKRKCIIYY